MSIALLSKVTFYGLMSDKEKVLEDLQDMGCIHVVPLGKNSGHAETAGLSQTTRNALTFLLSCPEKRHQILNPTNFHAASVEGRALEIKERIQPLQNERDFLLRRIGELCPWGYFTSPPPEVLGELKLWLYIVPHYQMKELQGSGVVWKEINRDNRFRYVVIVASQKPTSTPGEYVPMEDVSLSDLESRLEEVEVELEDLQAARVALTRWLTLFIRTVNQLENQEARANAAQQTFDSAPIFAVQGWTKLSNGQNLQSYAQRTGLALTVEEPGPEDMPPTLLENPEPVAGGQDLVSFYMMPSYRLWDPSSIVFFSFAVFFAMILSDAGYGALLGVILIGYWARMGHTETGCRMRRLFAVLVAASVVWGVLTGSFFGVSPPKGSILASLKLFDIQDATTMMIVSILIGAVHITIATLGTAWTHRGKRQAVASIGWTAIIVGGCALWLSSQDLVPEVFADVSPWIMGVGMFCVLLFSGSKSNLPWRLVDGVLALAGVTRAFGDVLSYLRLFALGLASASLALAFNDLAQQISESVAGFGTFLALLILLLGHGINLVLGIMSGVVHGLRLNYIEFFNWGVPEEGTVFRAFAKKEGTTWSP